MIIVAGAGGHYYFKVPFLLVSEFTYLRVRAGSYLPFPNKQTQSLICTIFMFYWLEVTLLFYLGTLLCRGNAVTTVNIIIPIILMKMRLLQQIVT